MQTLCGYADFFVIVLLQGSHILDGDDTAFLDDCHPVAQPLHLSQDVRREENGRAAFVFFTDESKELVLH